MEDPSSAPGRAQLASNGLEIVPVPVDEEGLQAERLPEAGLDAVTAAKQADDLGTPGVEQLALADFLERGELDRHLRRTRSVYRARRDALVDALERHLPDCPPAGVAAGLHLVVHLPAGTDEQVVLDAARARRLGLSGISEHRVEPGPPALLLGYGRLPEPAIEAAVRLLADSLPP